MSYPRIRVRIADVRITADDLDVEGLAAVDDEGNVHFVVPGDCSAAHYALEDMIDGPDMYEIV